MFNDCLNRPLPLVFEWVLSVLLLDCVLGIYHVLNEAANEVVLYRV